MTTGWDHAATVSELEPTIDVIESFREWSAQHGDPAGAALAMAALVPLRSLVVGVWDRKRQDDREEAEEEAVIAAALRAGETVDDFLSAAVARELACRAEAVPG